MGIHNILFAENYEKEFDHLFRNQSVAYTLGISVKTVEKHRANVMTKLHVSDLPSLIRKAIEYKLIFLE